MTDWATARSIAHEFVNSFGVDECDGGTHSIHCLKLTEQIAGATSRVTALETEVACLANAWAPIIQYIGELWAAATHDYETADPSEVGMGGVPIKAWRDAYREGVKDMAEGIVSRLPKDQQEATAAAIKQHATDELNKLRAALEQTDG